MRCLTGSTRSCRLASRSTSRTTAGARPPSATPLPCAARSRIVRRVSPRRELAGPAALFLGQPLEFRDQPLPRAVRGEAEPGQRAAALVFLLLEHAQQDVLGADVVVPEAQRLA